jgi:hypothetical protein
MLAKNLFVRNSQNGSFVRHHRKGEGAGRRVLANHGVILCLVPSRKRAGPWGENDDITLTLDRILQQRQHPLFKPLASLWEEARALPRAWTFPAEECGVSGFAGLAGTFVIGEQPSFSPWRPKDKGRRLLYDSLVACGAAQAHLTDIVKSRGKKKEWQGWSTERLRPHIDLLCRELKELQPQRLIFLGDSPRDCSLLTSRNVVCRRGPFHISALFNGSVQKTERLGVSPSAKTLDGAESSWRLDSASCP